MQEALPHEPLPESRFIVPDVRCPHPERWHSTDGDSTEVEVTELIAGLVRGLQPRIVVETGAAFGQTTRAICGALDRNGDGFLWAYESDSGRLDKLKRHPRLFLKADSLRADLGDLLIDLAFLDTLYETRVPEFLHLRRWMRAGTIVAIHDTAPDRGGHRIADGVSLREQIKRDLVEPGLVRAIDLPTPRGLTLCEVLA